VKVPDSLGSLPERLIEEAEVIVGVGAVRIAIDRLPIGSDRLVGATEIVEERGEVEMGDRIGGGMLDRSPIVRLGLNGLL